jgi:hypothetical protein
MPPLVSCLTPTYNRFPSHGHLLAEAVESFLRQDYPKEQRELLILSDCPKQEIFCAEPGVRILNYPTRFASLGAKFNELCKQARGAVLLPWEDDDIALPRRISQAVQALEFDGWDVDDKGRWTFAARVQPRYDYWNPQRCWFLTSGTLSKDHHHGVCHNSSAFTKEAFLKVGGYPHISGAQDIEMDRRLKKQVKVAPPLPDGQPSDWQYIYRWGVSDVHLSGRKPHDEFYTEVGTRPIFEGRFQIWPVWLQDYTAMAKALAVAS